MNKVILSGNLCKDIELVKYNNKSCVRNSVAVKRDYKNSDGNYETDFFNITLWEYNADFIDKYAKKGTKVILSGRLINNGYEAEDGTKKVSNEVMVDHIEIVSARKEQDIEATAEEIFGDKTETVEEKEDDFLD